MSDLRNYICSAIRQSNADRLVRLRASVEKAAAYLSLTPEIGPYTTRILRDDEVVFEGTRERALKWLVLDN